AMLCIGARHLYLFIVAHTQYTPQRISDLAIRTDATVHRLDLDHATLALHVQSLVRSHRSALLLEFGAHFDPVVGRGPYRGGGQPAFIDTLISAIVREARATDCSALPTTRADAGRDRGDLRLSGRWLDRASCRR